MLTILLIAFVLLLVANVSGFSPFSAKRAAVRLNGQIVTAKKWDVDPKVDKLDVTNFEGNGFGDYIGGILDIDVTIEFDMDGQANPYDAPRALVPGTIITGSKLYMNNTGSAGTPAGPFWDIPSALVVGTPGSSAVREASKGTIRLAGKGTFTAPTGNMTAT